MIEAKNETENQVNSALDAIRPYLHQDGGDVSLVEITEDMIVKIKLHGACKDCNMKIMTMRAGIIENIKRFAPAIKDVQEVN